MRTSSLEIREGEYLIRLSKDDYDLQFIQYLIKKIQIPTATAQLEDRELENDMIKSFCESALNDRFDHLSEK